MQFDSQEDWNTEQMPEGHEARFENRLESAFGKPKQNRWKSLLAYAAVLGTLLIGFAIAFDSSQTENNFAEEEQESSFPIAEAQKYYAQSVSTQLKVLDGLAVNPIAKDIVSDTKKEIEELEEQYKKLESELLKTGDQRVAAAMIGNFQSRIKILETLIQQLNYVNQLNKEENENLES